MKMYIATAIEPALLGDSGRRLQLEAQMHPTDPFFKRKLQALRNNSVGLISDRERCEEFLKVAKADGLSPRPLKRWKAGGGLPQGVHRWERKGQTVPHRGPGGQFMKVMVKHRGAR